MATITRATLQEKLRQKDFLAVLGLGMLLLLLMSTGQASISIDGEAITGFPRVLGLMLTLMNALICLLAIGLSCATIANEYKRGSAHLVWVRNISQPTYHIGLTLGNCLASVLASGLLHLVLAIFLILQGQADLLPRVLPAFGLSLISLLASATLTSVLGLFLPPLAGAITALLLIGAELAHQTLETLSFFSDGSSSRLLRLILSLAPNLSGVTRQIHQLMLGRELDPFPLIQVLFWTYLISWVLLLYRKKAA